LSAYLDASMVVSLFLEDCWSDDAAAWLAALEAPPTISRWTALEFSSALGVLLRAGSITAEERSRAERELGDFVADLPIADVTDRDLISARDMIRFGSAALKAGDALHLAIGRRVGLPIKTFDRQLTRAAEMVGVEVA